MAARLSEPCRTLVPVAVLTGMRIGETFALRWKAVDLVQSIICIRETVSEGKFGSPKTKSSRRDIPMSQAVREAFQAQLARCRQRGSEDLAFTTRNQTPLNPKNLIRRVLRPACKALGLPLISSASGTRMRHSSLKLGSHSEQPRRFLAIRTLKQHSTSTRTQSLKRKDVRSTKSLKFCSLMFTKFQRLQKMKRSTI